MSIIKNHLQIELSIDQILYRLRLLRLNEIQTHTLSSQKQLLSVTNGGDGHSTPKCNRKRPGLETRSASQLNVILKPMMTIDEMEEQPRKRTEIIDPETMQDLLLISHNINPPDLVVKSSRSTPMVVALSDNIQLEQNMNVIKKIKKEQKQQLKEMRRERSSTKRGLLMTKPE